MYSTLANRVQQYSAPTSESTSMRASSIRSVPEACGCAQQGRHASSTRAYLHAVPQPSAKSNHDHILRTTTTREPRGCGTRVGGTSRCSRCSGCSRWSHFTFHQFKTSPIHFSRIHQFTDSFSLVHFSLFTNSLFTNSLIHKSTFHFSLFTNSHFTNSLFTFH